MDGANYVALPMFKWMAAGNNMLLRAEGGGGVYREEKRDEKRDKNREEKREEEREETKERDLNRDELGHLDTKLSVLSQAPHFVHTYLCAPDKKKRGIREYVAVQAIEPKFY